MSNRDAIEVKLELDELLEKKRMTPSDRRLLVLLLEKLFSLLGWTEQQRKMPEPKVEAK